MSHHPFGSVSFPGRLGRSVGACQSLILFALAFLAGNSTAAQTTQPNGSDETSKAHIAAGYGKLPLSFEANRGQTDKSVKFVARGQGYGLFLTDTGAVLSLSKPAVGQSDSPHGSPKSIREHPQPQLADVVRMELPGARMTSSITGEEQLPGKANYLIGNDPGKWHSSIQTFAKVKYAEVYPGVDLVYYGNQQQLEYDFVVAPGASALPIRLHFDGAKHLKLDADGDLRVIGQHGEIAFRKPVVYQQSGGQRLPVEGDFTLLAGNTVRFRLGSYDHSRPLVIDPVLSYSTYLGGSYEDSVGAIAVDASGNTYVTGTSYSLDFPVTPGAFQPTNNSTYTYHDTCFITKLNPTGTALVYSTYLGGGKADSSGAIAVNTSGNAYIAGEATSLDFPVTPGAYQTVSPGFEAFVTELNVDGTALVYSTFIGGTGSEASASGIALDSSGDAFITGVTYGSSGFPVTPGAFQTVNKAAIDTVFVTKLNPAGSALEYSTLLGGSTNDYVRAIALNSAGNAYVTGYTDSTDFPVTAGAFQSYNNASPHNSSYATGFVTEMNTTGTALVYSTYLGGSVDDSTSGIALDDSGNAYLVGSTGSPDFPVTPGAFQIQGTTSANAGAAFVTKLNSTGTGLVYSTFLGGSTGGQGGKAIAVDGSGNAYVTGTTTGTDFPITSNAFQSSNMHMTGNYPASVFVTKMNSAGNALIFSTYLGGSGPTSNDIPLAIALDPSGDAFVGGQTTSTNFPVSPSAFQTTNHASASANNPYSTGFITKLALGSLNEELTFSSIHLAFGGELVGDSTAAQSVTLTNNTASALPFTSIQLTGADASSFLLSNPCGASLAAGDNCTISVRLAPTRAGTLSAAVTLTDSAVNSPQTIRLSGSGIAPFVLSTTSLPFGNEPVGESTDTQVVTLTNNGALPVTISSIKLAGAGAASYKTSNNCGASVAPGATCRIGVRFVPTGLGPASAAITVTDSATGSPQSISLSGTGITPATASLTLSANSISFGNEPVGYSADAQAVFVTNSSSTAVLYFKSITLTGPDTSSFVTSNTCGGVMGGFLNPGATCRIGVRFVPGAPVPFSAAVTLIDNASGSPQNIALSGTGIPAPAATLSLSTNSLAFGSETVGNSSNTGVVTVTNTSTATLYFKTITLGGVNASSFVTSNTCNGSAGNGLGGSLAPGARCRIGVRFVPTTVGPLTGTITLTDDAASSPQTIALSGTGH